MAGSEKERLSRRLFLSSLLKAGISVPRTWAEEKKATINGTPEEALRKVPVSPPGSISQENLSQKCNGCQLCIDGCPGKVLKPSVTDYGVAGIMLPVMDFHQGYCLEDCTFCGDICPTGAIRKFTLEEKEKMQIALPKVVRSLCLATEGLECNACAQACLSGAIKIKEDYVSSLVERNGRKYRRKYPVVEDILCTGCGLCEYKCPSTPAKAIHLEGLREHE